MKWSVRIRLAESVLEKDWMHLCYDNKKRDSTIKKACALVGDTEPASADQGTIRANLGTDGYEQTDSENRGLRNLVHALEDHDATEREIEL